MRKALLVIDMQEITVGRNHAKMFNYPADLVERVNEVIRENCEKAYTGEEEAELIDGKYDYGKNMSMAGRGTLIIYIRNLMKDSFLNKFAPVKCYDGSPESQLVAGLEKHSMYVFGKYSGDAFSNIEFASLLRDSGIDRVEIVGVDGGGCVALTALGALKAGYKTVLNTKAIGTCFVEKQAKLYEKLKKAGAQFI